MTHSALAHTPAEIAERSAETDGMFACLAARYENLFLEHHDDLHSVDVEVSGRVPHDFVLDEGPRAEALQLAEWRQHLDRDPAQVERLANCWLTTFERLLAGLPSGTAVVINLLTGRFVVASSRLAALDAFEARFGRHTTVAWLHEVGRGIVMRGGLA